MIVGVDPQTAWLTPAEVQLEVTRKLLSLFPGPDLYRVTGDRFFVVQDIGDGENLTYMIHHGYVNISSQDELNKHQLVLIDDCVEGSSCMRDCACLCKVSVGITKRSSIQGIHCAQLAQRNNVIYLEELNRYKTTRDHECAHAALRESFIKKRPKEDNHIATLIIGVSIAVLTWASMRMIKFS